MGLLFTGAEVLEGENRDWARAVPGTTIAGWQNASDPGDTNVNIFWDLTTDDPGESRIAVVRSREAGDNLKIFARKDGEGTYIPEAAWPVGRSHIAIVADWTNSLLTVYVNGIEVAQEVTDWVGGSSDTDSAIVAFGSINDNGGEQHDLRIWRRALSAEEITNLLSPHPRSVPDYHFPMIAPCPLLVPSLGKTPTSPLDRFGEPVAAFFTSSYQGSSSGG